MGARFVILRHDVNGGAHFDLMLEIPGEERLRTYQLARWPLAPGEDCACAALPPHRRAYLEYEGEVTGGRGTVTREAAGTWQEANGLIMLEPGPALRIADGRAQAHSKAGDGM